MKTATKNVSISQSTDVSPVFLVDTDEREGLLTAALINESNEVKMYYTALGKLAEKLLPYSKTGIIRLNLIVNEYENFHQDRYFIALKVMGDILKECKRVKVHILDEDNARKLNLLED